ncbi:MAG TPA: ParM/StbA family protein [Clostridia bacterium]|nr:ParM/StbA family protein [Clostridia bacterium]
MAQLLGLDIGYGFVKATNGENGYVFPSVVGDASEKQIYYSTIQQTDPLGNLRVRIDDRVFFVGKSAIRHSNLAFRALSTTRSEGTHMRVLSLSAVALFCDRSQNKFEVVTGLPPGRMHLAKYMVDQVKGIHRIGVYQNGTARDAEVDISSVEVVPQPLGTYWSQTLSGSEPAAEHLEGRTGVIDIGYVTTDLAAIEDGEFVPGRSTTIKVGLADAYVDIASRLFREYGLEREPYTLDGAVIKGKVTVSGEEVDITPICNGAFERLATKVLVELMSVWRIQEFDRLYLSGGGGQSLSPYLLPHVPQGKLADDPITANCRGFWAWGKRQRQTEI